MIVRPIHTEAITANAYALEDFLDRFISNVSEHEVVVVTSKVVSLCEGRVVSPEKADIDTLLEQEADYFLPRSLNSYEFGMSIKNNTLVANAGIDQSNGDGYFILWPKDPQSSANTIREHLCHRFNRKEIGVIITDSRVLPLRWGCVGTVIGYSGFLPLKNYMGENDLFGRPFKVAQKAVAEGIAIAAVLVMGEGAESTPLAIVSDIEFVQFQDRNPTSEELAQLSISKDDDIFAPLLNSVPWKKGKK